MEPFTGSLPRTTRPMSKGTTWTVSHISLDAERWLGELSSRRALCIFTILLKTPIFDGRFEAARFPYAAGCALPERRRSDRRNRAHSARRPTFYRQADRAGEHLR